MKKKIESCGLVSLIDENHICSEQFRSIKTSIDFSYKDNRCRYIMFTSACPSEGKSTCAANLAVTYAKADKRVLLIDCDVHRPTVHKTFYVPNGLGITNYLSGRYDWGEVSQKSKIDSLTILTSGPNVINISEAFSSEKFDNFLKNLEDKFDLVIFDTPPVLNVSDSKILAGKVEEVVLIVREGKTNKKDLKETIQQLSMAKANILGIVYTGTKINLKNYYY